MSVKNIRKRKGFALFVLLVWSEMGAVRLCAVVRRCEFKTESCSTFWEDGRRGRGAYDGALQSNDHSMCIIILTRCA